MGYRVGFQCFESSESAHDYVLSQTQPLLLPDGTFIRPEKTGKHWFIQGVEVKLTFPECSFAYQFKDGVSVGSSFVVLFALMFGFKVLRQMIYGGTKDD